MKQMTRFTLCLLATLLMAGRAQAQDFACTHAAQYNAGYTKALLPKEAVSISLRKEKATAKETADKSSSSNSLYVINGATSPAQFTSLAANIGFSTCSKIPSLELYKLEVKNGTRTFTIPAGANGSHSVMIPIQVITPPALQSPNRNGGLVWGQGSFKIKFLTGYLAAGEYVLLDMDSWTADGTRLKGVAFTIK